MLGPPSQGFCGVGCGLFFKCFFDVEESEFEVDLPVKPPLQCFNLTVLGRAQQHFLVKEKRQAGLPPPVKTLDVAGAGERVESGFRMFGRKMHIASPPVEGVGVARWTHRGKVEDGADLEWQARMLPPFQNVQLTLDCGALKRIFRVVER